MAQIRSSYPELRVPFAKMSWTPDIPSTALSANEYNTGSNVEADTRGIRSVFGETEILSQVSGTPIYITGGYRGDGKFYYVFATVTAPDIGHWYCVTATGAIIDVTPANVTLNGYTTATNITSTWNGNTLIVNDSIHPPMFLSSNVADNFVFYSNQESVSIHDMYYSDATTFKITLNKSVSDVNVPYNPPENIRVTDVLSPAYFNRIYTIVNAFSFTLEINDPGLGLWSGTGDFTGDQFTPVTTTSGTLAVGQSIVGNDVQWGAVGYVVTIIGPGTNPGDYQIDYTFGTPISGDTLITWQAYTQGGQVSPEWQWNYNPDWKNLTANFVRSFNSPNVGTLLIAGNLTSTDLSDVKTNYPTTVRWSQNFGLNQTAPTWIPTISNVANELEVPVRGPVLDGFPCNGNFFVCSYWDTAVFSPLNFQTTQVPILGVKLFNQGRGLLNANCWANADDTIYGVDARDFWVFNGQEFRPLGNQRVKNYFFDNLNPLYTDQVFVEMNTQKNQVEFYYPDLDSTGYCNKMIAYRFDLDTFNPPRDVPDVIMACESPILRDSTPDYFDPASRCISFVRAVEDSKICQKDQGYSFVGNTAIASLFQRDNIHLSKDYSTKAMTHRILPEINNINDYGIVSTSVGTVDITVGGSDSAGQAVTYKPTQTYTLNTSQPWIQVNQNAYRLQSIKIENSSTATAWQCSATTWQFTEVEDDR